MSVFNRSDDSGIARGERALLVVPERSNDGAMRPIEAWLDEAEGLAAAIGIDVVERKSFLLRQVRPASLFGKGQAEEIADLARAVGETEAAVTRLLDELKRRGVFSVTRAGVIYSRRLRKDADLSKKRAAAGRKGGLASTGQAPEICSSKSEAKRQAKPKPQSPDSRLPVSDETGGHPDETGTQDPAKQLFDLGVQLLTAFLLTLPFTQRFAELDQVHVNLFVVVVLMAATATGLLIAPVSLHRHLFQQRRKDDLVRWGHRLALAGLTVLGLAVAGVVLLVMSVVMSTGTAALLAGGVLAGLVLLWLVLPLVVRHQRALSGS